MSKEASQFQVKPSRVNMSNLIPSVFESSQKTSQEILEILRVVSCAKTKLQSDGDFKVELDDAESKLKCIWLRLMTEHLEDILIKNFITRINLFDQEESSEAGEEEPSESLVENGEEAKKKEDQGASDSFFDQGETCDEKNNIGKEKKDD
jgi:hypothetical protein